MKVAIIGGGLIGQERIEAINKLIAEGVALEITYVIEPSIVLREKLQNKYKLNCFEDHKVVLSSDVDWIFICTPHDVAAELAREFLSRGFKVMLEKPLGRSLKECDEIITSTESVSKLHVGFNYRFYDGINAALRDAKNGVFGKLISVKFTLAHGNAPGMEKSWKLNKDRCGGGCLIDPGVHILDLMLLLSSGTLKIDGMSKWSGFWNTGIEEEVHLLLSDEMQTIFTADISLNRWRSKFSMELNGLEGYGVVEGRGRSYGPQSYRRGKRWGWQSGVNQSDSEELIIGSHAADNSFYNETKQLLGFEVSGSDNTIRVSDAVSSRRVMDLLERIKSQIS